MLFNTAIVLSIAISVVIPGISSLLSRSHWPTEITALITMFLAAANGFLTEWSVSANATHYDWRQALVIAVGSYITAAIARVQLWSGTKIDATLLAVGSSTDATAPEGPTGGAHSAG